MENLLAAVTAGGGLAFFLFGMNILGSGLEKLSGGRMEKTLEKMTNNLFKSLLLGLIVTAAIQSSSATTVIVVGLVNAGILKLKNAIGVIMGANIGTTVTSVILSLGDLDKKAGTGAVLKLFKPTTLAPIIAIIGIIILMTAKKNKRKIVGEIMLGFGVLFNGMFIMTDAVAPLSNSPVFRQLFATLSNPLLGILAGVLVTAVIQSSSASVGILQAIASSGAITYSAAFPIIMGQNIGTCVTSIISSIGANKNAKRTAMVHLYFNVIGTIIFFIAIYLIQTFIGFSFWDSPIDMGGISAVHIVFNVVTTAIFLPFTWVLEKLAIATVKDKKFENSDDELKEVATLDERFLRSPSMALSQCQQVVELMGEYAGKNFNRAVNLFKEYDEKKLDVIQDFEDAIDRMEDKINNYLVKLTSQELTEKENKTVTYLLKLVSEFERVGDYSINISDIAKEQHEESMTFSESALRELDIVEKAASEIINMAKLCVENNDEKICNSIEPLEETIDAMVEKLKARHIERLKTSNCTIDNGIRFLNILTNVERISDHCSNIGVYVISFNSKAKELDRHVFVENLHRGITKEYTAVSEMYYDKYMKNL